MSIPIYKFALREDLKDKKEFLPTRAEPKATGWDVRAALKDKEKIVINPFDRVAIPLGFRAFCPDGWWLELKPRSSTFAKKHLHCLYGTIDETYEGEMVFACQYIPEFEFIYSNFSEEGLGDMQPAAFFDKSIHQSLTINFGDAIGQLIPIERQEMEVIGITNEEYDNDCKQRNAERGAGGFGSTDKK